MVKKKKKRYKVYPAQNYETEFGATIRLLNVKLYDDEILEHRKFDCKYYSECLYLAARATWRWIAKNDDVSFSCIYCQAYLKDVVEPIFSKPDFISHDIDGMDGQDEARIFRFQNRQTFRINPVPIRELVLNSKFGWSVKHYANIDGELKTTLTQRPA